jgi:outer membrane protein, heavy metal efflux system
MFGVAAAQTRALGAILTSWCLLAPATVRADEEPLTLDDAMAIAVASNPTLAATRYQMPVARAAVDVAKQRPNPELALDETKETPNDALTLSFPIETGGKRYRRGLVATAGVDTAGSEVNRHVLALRNQVRRAFFALCAAERRAKEASALAELAARARAAAADRFESGDVPRLDLLQTQLGAAQTDSEAIATKALLESQRTQLNVLLGRPPGARTEVEGDLGEGRIPDLDAATAAALAGNGDLAVLDGRIREQAARVNLAKAQRSPDMGIQGAVTHRDPDFDWGWRLGVSLTLPVFHDHGAEVVFEQATLTQLQAQRQAEVAAIQGAIASAWALADARGRQYARYRDEILETAAEVESMAEEAYRSGQTGLAATIQAITSVRDTRNRAIDTGLAYQDALADLESAIGAPLP